MVITSVEVVSKPSADRLSRCSQEFTVPVIVQNAMANWNALDAWSPGTLRNRYGDVKVQVFRSSDGVIRGDPTAGFTKSTEEMKLSKFFDLLDGSIRSMDKYYLAQLPLMGPFSAMMEDIDISAFVAYSAIKSVNLWLGPAGVVSPLHHDPEKNFLCQVRGSKNLTLFPPEQSANLYPFSLGSPLSHISQVDIDHPDLRRFRRYERAKAVEVLLSAGEMIYIPDGWWHQVSSLTESISVNVWH